MSDPLIGEGRQPLDEYRIGEQESLLSAVVSRFEAIDSERVQDTRLQELTDVDSLSEVVSSDSVTHVAVVLWGHPTYLSSERIVIYPPNDG